MDLIELFSRLRTQEKALLYLERVRWGGSPVLSVLPERGGSTQMRANTGRRRAGSAARVTGPSA